MLRWGKSPSSGVAWQPRGDSIAGTGLKKTLGVLVIYATTHGHTPKIARRIADALRHQDGEVDLLDASKSGDADPGGYDAVVAGGSVLVGRHQRELVDWVKANRKALTECPSAFSVSLIAADDTDEAGEATQKCIDDFIDETGWKPARTISIAGALQYREYDLFMRTLMRLKMRAGGHPTDASQDYEYTDWDSVERFGRECGAR